MKVLKEDCQVSPEIVSTNISEEEMQEYRDYVGPTYPEPTGMVYDRDINETVFFCELDVSDKNSTSTVTIEVSPRSRMTRIIRVSDDESGQDLMWSLHEARRLANL